EVLRPQAGVDAEAELQLDGRDALWVAGPGLRGPRDGAGDRIAGHHPWEEEADGECYPGGEEIHAQPAKEEGAHRYAAGLGGGAGRWAQPQLSRTTSRTGSTTSGSPLPALILE